MAYLNYKVNLQWRGESFPLTHCIKAWQICDVCSSVFPLAIVCRNSLKVSDKYERAVDNSSVELRYNDQSGAIAFTSLWYKK